MTDGTPEDPVTRVEVEHEDGTVRVLEGPEAQAWVEWVAKAFAYLEKHGGKVPDIVWDEYNGE